MVKPVQSPDPNSVSLETLDDAVKDHTKCLSNWGPHSKSQETKYCHFQWMLPCTLSRAAKHKSNVNHTGNLPECPHLSNHRGSLNLMVVVLKQRRMHQKTLGWFLFPPAVPTSFAQTAAKRSQAPLVWCKPFGAKFFRLSAVLPPFLQPNNKRNFS